jgi:chromosome segregation ATPase
MKLKRMELKQFKGINERTIDFFDFTIIKGQNGSGKTTIADAYFWALTNKDYALNDNPNIRPINLDVDASVPSVSLVFDVDGVELTYTKSQKAKVSGDKVSLINAYEINSVPKTERDAREYLADKGIDLDKLLILSHPDVFVKDINEKKIREDRRNILFGMVSEISDLDIAKKIGADDVAKLLENYTKEEIEAMQNATIRKCKEEYGKDGEIIDAQIVAKEQAKIEVNIQALTAERDNLKSKLADNEDKQKNVEKAFEEVRSKKARVAELKQKIDEINSDMVAEHNAKLTEFKIQKANLENELELAKNEVMIANKKIADAERYNKSCKETIDKARNDYTTEKAKVYEGSEHCPACGRKYPEDKIEKAKLIWDEEHNRKLNAIISIGNNAKADIENNNNTIDALKSTIEAKQKDIEKLQGCIEELQTTIDGVKDFEIPETDEIKAIKAEIAEIEATIHDVFDTTELQNEHHAIQGRLDIITKEMAKTDLNARIDEQIKELQDKKIDLAQSKANAEKILNQLSQVQMQKNNVAQDSVNSHFELVKFKLFDVQKNGEVKDACIPTIDGKAFVDCNTALRTLAEIDIIKGFQKYYNVVYPTFLDEAEHLTANTMERMKLDTQFIFMACSEER